MHLTYASVRLKDKEYGWVDIGTICIYYIVYDLQVNLTSISFQSETKLLFGRKKDIG